jgi:hypothetical protein
LGVFLRLGAEGDASAHHKRGTGVRRQPFASDTNILKDDEMTQEAHLGELQDGVQLQRNDAETCALPDRQRKFSVGATYDRVVTESRNWYAEDFMEHNQRLVLGLGGPNHGESRCTWAPVQGDHQGQHSKYRGYVDTYEVILVDRTTLITVLGSV